MYCCFYINLREFGYEYSIKSRNSNQNVGFLGLNEL